MYPGNVTVEMARSGVFGIASIAHEFIHLQMDESDVIS